APGQSRRLARRPRAGGEALTPDAERPMTCNLGRGGTTRQQPGWSKRVIACLFLAAGAVRPAAACDICPLPGATLAAPSAVCQYGSGTTDVTCASRVYNVAL